MKSISDLPWDLIEEILCRVPITSIRAVLSTCKRWNTLSRDQIFTKKHCGKAAKEFLLNINYDDHDDIYDFGPARFNLQNTKELPSSLKKIGNMLAPVKIYKNYQCDGLLLSVTMDNLRLVVWNPYLGHTRWIEPKNSYRSRDVFPIGYDNKKNHKVLRMYLSECEMYDFNSSSWRVLDIDFSSNPWRVLDITFYSFDRRASLKGNSYFVPRGNFVVCFDFTRERFGPRLHLPLPVDFDRQSVTLSCVREEQLAVFGRRCSNTTYEIGIWITTEIEPNAVSWSKFFKVDFQHERGSYFSSKFQFHVHSFFIDKEKKVAVVSGRNLYDYGFESIIVGEDGYVEKTGLGVGDVFSYVPSSVQIQ